MKELQSDLNKSDKNMDIPFSQILNISSEEKRWGTRLKIIFNLGDKLKTYKFSVVKGWVKYPAKDPLEFQRMNWNPLINFFNLQNKKL